jgi:WD40-like Beta Propeller Repeat
VTRRKKATTKARACLLAPTILASLTLLCGAPAQARTVHVFAGSFGGEGSGPGQLKEPRGMAVNDSTEALVRPAAGDVYVVDTGNDRVERFSSIGVYLGQFDGSGTFEVEGKVATGSAAPTGKFSKPTQIAVDNSGSVLDPSVGDVYVVDSGHGVIDKFTETGEYVGQITGATCEAEEEAPPCKHSNLLPFNKGEEGINGVAVDPAGTLWADESAFPGDVYSFSDGVVNAYVSTRAITSGLQALGVDAEDNLYLKTGGSEAHKYTTSGELLLDPFGSTEGSLIGGIAVDSVAGEVYIDYESKVEAFTLGGSQLESFGSGHLEVDQFGRGSRGVAVDASDGTVFTSDFPKGDVAVFDAVTLPTVSLTALSEQSPRSVTLSGAVNPEGSPVTSCVFEYVAAGEYEPGASDPYAKGKQVPCEPGAAGLGSGSSPVSVSARITGLVPETKYHYRLVAENKANLPSASADQVFTAGPVLGGEFAADVASSSATLGTVIDPNGDDAHYYLQYGTSGAYGSYAPLPPPGVDLGTGTETQPISVHLQGLRPGASYHYRFVVVQDGEEFTEPDRVFTTQDLAGGGVLADARAWELVSPADNKGALIEQFSEGVGDEIQAADNGSGITYLTAGSPVGEDPQGRSSWAQVLSARVPGGWRSTDLSLPRRIPGNEELAALQAAKPEYEVFSSDLSLAAVEPSEHGTPPLSSQASERTIYLRNDPLCGAQPAACYTPLVTAGNVPEGTEFGGESEHSNSLMYFVTATPDLSHVLLATPFALTPEAVYENTYLIQNQWNLYEWSAGKLALVNILPEDEGGQATIGPEPSVRLAGGAVDEGNPSGVNPSAISSDGRRVAWDLGVPGKTAAGGYEGLFVRDMVAGETVKVSGADGVFQWMSSDGSRVFYLENNDLYVCELVESEGELSCKYSDLTADHGVGETGGVQSLVSDVSSDGSYVYFVSTSVMTGTAGVGGMPNLYLLHDTNGIWRTSLVAVLGPEDERTWNETVGGGSPPDLSMITSRVSPDGRYLAFMSDRSLTGYDNTDAVSGHSDEEVYVYDAQGNGGAGALVCASCDPTGARPVGVFDPPRHKGAPPLLVDRHGVWAGSWLAGSIPGWDHGFGEGSRYQPRYLSDSGRLFFDSPDTLVPHATNGVEDVYEYEPAGVGGCTEATASGATVYSASAGGCVGLMSAGTSGQESAFFDASENGDDVFFISEAKLVAADTGNSYAVYDAHVCGSEGVPCVSEPVSPPPCSSGDSCKPAPSPQPQIFGPAPSATFSGSGNIAEEVKPKAKVRSKSKKKAKKKKRKGSKGKTKSKRAKRAVRPRAGRTSGKNG